MEKGKRTCNLLKEVRLQIAKANDIKYVPNECHHKGPCAGTCPACEAEVKYLEQQLQMRRVLGRAVVLTGIAASLTSLSACGQSTIRVPRHHTSPESELYGDVIADTCNTTEPVDTIRPIDNNTRPLAGVVRMNRVEPQFPGGKESLLQYLKDNRQYPADAVEEGIEGRVIVSFYVETDGSLSEIKVVKSLSPSLDSEALRLVKSMPKWIPGKVNDKARRMKYSIPVIFKFN